VQVKIIKEYSLFLKRVYAANPSKIPFKLQNNGEFFILAIDEYTKQIRIRYEFNVTVQTKKTYSVDDSKLVKARKEWKENVEKASAICKIILIPIELYNLKTSYEAISGAKTNEERGFAKIDFLGSVCDNMSGVFEVMGENVEKEFGKKLANRLTGAVSIVGAVCDYVGAMHKILKASGEGKHGVTAGNALIALSAVASAASTAVLITDVAVFGLAAGPLGLIGVGLFVVGAAVVWYFTEEPLEEWAKASMWGKKFKHSTIEQQIHDLHEVLAAFDVACYLYKEEGQQYASENGYYSDYNYYFTLRINPGMFNEKVSKI